LRALVVVVLVACGSQQAPTQTQTPAPSQTASTQTLAPAPSQSQSIAPTPVPTTCKTNDDCAMSTIRSCCAPCGLPPFADLKSEVETLKRRCAEVECAMRVPQECKPTESTDAYHAECQNASADPAKPGRRDDKACVAVRNPPAQTAPVAPATLTSTEACARDGDCVVSNFGSCCSSCQSSAYATNMRSLQARNHRCAIVDCAMDNRRERCEPIVDASLYRAVCRAGTCAGVKR